MKSRLLATAGIVTVMLIGSGIGGAIVTSRNALASRNSSGTYSLFAGTTPVVSFQTVGSSLWNNAWNDMAADMTNSLDRNGRGGMLAALRGVDGTVNAPAVSWTSESGSGLYRIGASDIGFAISGNKVFEFTAAGVTIPSGKTISSTTSPTTITPETNINAGSGLAYWKDIAGVVHVKGSFVNATGGTPIVMAATNPLAVGFRPLFARTFVCVDSGGNFHSVTVSTTGAIGGVSPALGIGLTLFVDPISFLSEQ